ncbi:MAG: hypothetical protein RIR21_468 [Pseudomonadota bacterium]|jgi:hypothetical protein
MKTNYVIIATLVLAASLTAQASDKEDKPTPEPQISVAETPALSEIPTMKQQGQRMAVLMEQLSKESNPDIRRRIMAEAMCPQ